MRSHIKDHNIYFFDILLPRKENFFIKNFNKTFLHHDFSSLEEMLFP